MPSEKSFYLILLKRILRLSLKEEKGQEFEFVWKREKQNMTAIAWAIMFAAIIYADGLAYQRPNYLEIEKGINVFAAICLVMVIICTAKDLYK